MIDENLPCFYIKASSDTSKQQDRTIWTSQYGSEASPAYTLRHPDPASPDSKNRYAAALYDSYNPEILFGEVLLVPEWTLPTLSQEEIRRNGGVPPPPQPILPTEFVIQLYNPDQQVLVRQHPSSWNSSQHWDFSMPQISFRQPSTSTLDRTQNDPLASEATPKVDFKWKRDGKLSKELICYLSGKSRNPDGTKKKHKEPDIPMAFFQQLRNVTIYEPNLSRVDMEDSKGFEVIMLISAAVIKDVYFGQLSQAFNISESRHNSLSTPSAVAAQSSPRLSTENKFPASQTLPPPPPRDHRHPQALPNTANTSKLPNQQPPRSNLASSQRPELTPTTSQTRPPPTDPRSQWEIDAETTRLKRQVEAEERERHRAEKTERKRVEKMLEEEAKAARKRQEEIDRETARLRRKYGTKDQVLPALPQRLQGQQHQDQRRSSTPMPAQYQHVPQLSPPAQQQRFNAPRPSVLYNPNAFPAGPYMPGPSPQQFQQQQQHGPYLQAPGNATASQSTFFGGNNNGRQTVKPRKSSFFGLRGGSGDDRTLVQKRSAVF